MKKILFCAVVFLSLQTHAQTWTQQNSNLSISLNAVKFTDNQNGCVVGDGAVILKTTDGGTNWANIPNLFSSLPINFTELDAIGNHIWICTDNAMIITSSDGGTTWSPCATPVVQEGIGLYHIDFCDLNHGWAVGEGLVLKTNDGGANWNPVTSVPTVSNWITGVSVVDSNTIYITDDGMIKKTVDGGLNWVTISVATNISKPIAFNSNDVWCVQALNNSQFAFKTTNGTTFNSFSGALPINGYLVNVDAVDFNNVVLASYTGSGYEVYKTNDGGATNWVPMNLGTIAGFINDISFPSLDNIWIVGGNGIIYKYSAPTTLTNEARKTNLSIYPNPFANQIVINADKPIGEVVIRNMVGNVVNSTKTNNKDISINLSSLPNGVYFISAGNTTKRVIKQ